MNPYKTLNIPQNSTQKEIKKAYYKLAKKYHPDTNQNNKEADLKFREINKAYEMINTEEKKFNFDTYGTSCVDGDIDILEMEKIFKQVQNMFENMNLPEEITGKMYTLDDI